MSSQSNFECAEYNSDNVVILYFSTIFESSGAKPLQSIFVKYHWI